MTQSFLKQIIKNFLLVFFILFLFLPAFSENDSPDQIINVPAFKGPAKQILDQISQNENLIFAYSSEISLDFEVTFEKQQMKLSDFLTILLKGKPIDYKVKGNKVQLYPGKVTISEPVNLFQVVRGTITDADSKLPLTGVMVAIMGTNPVTFVLTDASGNFKFEKIPIGRIAIQLSFLGYQTVTIPEVVVNSGKEVVLDVNLQESVEQLDEVIVTANKHKGQAINDMSLLSSRSISINETKRFTGGMDDPARVVASFAGVTATPDGGSDIIVRGNSPKYMRWRLDGIEITSPYHMDDQNASFGALTALNNSLLATSDFYTGAFSPEYGDVLTSVMDIKLRTGNNEKFESTFGIGVLGTDITLEGPFKKGYSGSYLMNYRYSTISLVKKLGIIDVEGAVSYQDVTFKTVLPTKKSGTFEIFALAGKSGISMTNMKPDGLTTPGRIKDASIGRDYDKGADLLNIGIIHIYSLNNNSFIKSSLSYSANSMNDDMYEFNFYKLPENQGEGTEDSLSVKKHTFKSNIENAAYRGTITYNNRINAKNKIQIGFKYTLWKYNYNQNIYNDQLTELVNVNDIHKYASSINSFISWKYSLNDKINFVTGLHNVNVLLNHKSTLEPRIAVNWQINNSNSIHAGYGKHSMMESVNNYYTKVIQNDGSATEPNKDLDLLKADHYILGYEKVFSDNLRAKLELYYQHLYNLPVENNDTSYYATINEGHDYRYVGLVNKGTGKNYGVELTLERFFDNSYYYLINASLFDSKYKSMEGVWRNTQYNYNYLINVLFGKEFRNMGRKQNKTLALNVKAFFCGGQRYIPLLRDAQGNLAVDPANNRYFDYSKAFDKKFGDLYSVNFSVSYKINKSHSTQELFLDLMNILNSKGKLSEFYDESQPGKVGYLRQMFFFPNLMFRVYF